MLEHERAQRAASRRRPRRPARCPPPRSECSTRSCTSVSIRARAASSPSTAISSAGRSSEREHAGAHRVVDVVVDVGDPVDQPDDLALERRRLARARWSGAGSRRAPARSGSARSSTSTTRSECSLWRKPRPKRSRPQRSSTSSPMWPNGGWPTSWPEPDRLRQVLVEPQRPRDRARDLRRLERVREPRAVVVALRRHEHLRLVLEPPERLASARSGRGRAGTACAAPQSSSGARASRRIGARGQRRQPRRLPRLLARRRSRCRTTAITLSHSASAGGRSRAARRRVRHEDLRDIAACAAATRAIGTRNGEQRHVVEPGHVEEVDRLRVAAVLAADAELEVRAAPRARPTPRAARASRRPACRSSRTASGR